MEKISGQISTVSEGSEIIAAHHYWSFFKPSHLEVFSEANPVVQTDIFGGIVRIGCDRILNVWISHWCGFDLQNK